MMRIRGKLMQAYPETGSETLDRAGRIDPNAISAFATDLVALVDRLEMDLCERDAANPEMAAQLHEIRLRSQRLFRA